MLLLILCVAGVLLVSFICSLSEATLLSLNVNSLPKSGEAEKSTKIWRGLKSRIGRPIAAILILNTVANTGGATMAGGAFDEAFGEEWLWLFSSFMTLAILFGSEILPKTLGVAYGRRLAPLLAWPLELSTRILSPFIWATEFITRRFENVSESATVTTSDIVTMASMARAGKAIGLEQENIIVNAIRLSHSPLKSAMIPKERVKYLVAGLDVEENALKDAEFQHTRYPVCEGDSLDSVAGIINHKKLNVLRKTGDRQTLLSTAQPPIFIEEDKSLLEALRTMLQTKTHMLMVRGRHGKVTGLLTLEDISSELIGGGLFAS